MSRNAGNDKPVTIVIFGATGDLTQRKLIPALWTLFKKRRLPQKLNIVGFSRSEWDSQAFRERMRDGVQKHAREKFDEAGWDAFSQQLHYVSGSTTDADGFQKLKAGLDELESGSVNRMYYLSVPPSIFAPIVHNLAELDMTHEEEWWRRVVVEKPFGHDLASARQLNQALHAELSERQIYRIDHYLAKETVQNILVFRFGNTIFEPVWNRNLIESVQITAIETVDVDRRAKYYDQAGVLRDMVQNHLLQLMTLVAMEPPASFSADHVRNEKLKVLQAVRTITPESMRRDAVAAQYRDYTDAEGVQSNSKTPTYAAIRLFVDNWRWQGVPFYLRSGKALKEKRTEITIQFKSPPINMFPLPNDYAINENLLSVCIQPDEGIHLRVEAKVPDTLADMQPVDLEFNYADTFGAGTIPEAYERLLLEALAGDASLFTRADSIERSWEIIEPLLSAWEDNDHQPVSYERGSWGPAAANEMLANLGHRWMPGCGISAGRNSA